MVSKHRDSGNEEKDWYSDSANSVSEEVMNKSGETGEKIWANIILVDCGIMDDDY